MVRYGQGLHAYPAILDEHVFAFLPDHLRRFAFVYHTGIPHEVAAAHELTGLPITEGKEKRLELIPLDHYPTASDLRETCEGRIVFGWYALDHQLDLGAITPDEANALFVTSTHMDHAQNGTTAVAIQPDDREIGRRAAQMLLADFSSGADEPGSTFADGVAVVAERYWVNWQRLRAWATRLGVPAPPDLLRQFDADPLCGPNQVSDRE